MATLLQDLRYALRLLRKSPGFTTVAVITLALGVGANAVIFSVVNAVMLRPLPVAEPGRLMMLFHSYPKINLPRASVMPFALGYYREHLQSFSSLAGETMWRGPQNMIVSGEPQRVKTVLVTANFFSTLGVEPQLGRSFTAEEDQPGKNREVVLSNGVWKQQFGRDPQIAGKTLSLDGVTYTIIGVMPQGFELPSGAGLWTPLALSPQEAQSTHEYLDVVGRLKPDVTQGQAQAELAGISAQLLRQFPELAPTGFHVFAQPMPEVMQENLRPALLVLLAAVGCVLLIACANVANLLLARASARQREIAVRSALGASRVRLVRQLLTESTLLSLCGGVLGLLLAYRGTDLLLALVPIEIPSFVHISVDSRVVLFTLGLAVCVGLLFGIVPALHSSADVVAAALKSGGRGATAYGHDAVRNALVVAEVGLALVLLACSGLLIRTFIHVRESDPGFSSRNTLTAWISLRAEQYSTHEKMAAFYQQLLQRVSSLPQVKDAAIGSTLPLIADWTQSFQVQGYNTGAEPHAFFAAVSPHYFSALGIPLLRGRTFTESDGPSAPLVVMVDERAAHTYWPGENPVGKLINIDLGPEVPGGQAKTVWREVIGVVGSVKHLSALADESKGEVYLPYLQNPMRTMSLVVRSEGNPADLGPALRHEVAQLDRTQAVYDVLTMDQYLDRFISQPRFNMILLAAFGALALLLSAIGIYGLISYWVVQRTREMGIRMALGARSAEVMQLVLGQTLRLVVIGVAAGLVVALLATRALSGLLYGVGRYDPLTFIAIPVLLSAIALFAGFIPARRATRVDPMVVLRYE
jgi:putative ABC transport system permease protein